MSASISTLPNWKKNSTADEWLQELAAMAIANPEHWKRIVVVYEEANAEGYSIATRWVQRGIPSNTDTVGTLEGAKHDVIEYMKGRQI